MLTTVRFVPLARIAMGLDMKQLLFLSVVTLLGGAAALQTPFWGVLLYYGFAVLRPQYLWQWALPVEVRWSLIAAMIVLVTFMLNFSRVLSGARFNRVLGLILLYGLLIMMSMVTAFDPAVAQAWGVEYAKIMLIAVVASLVIQHLWQVRAMALVIFLSLGYVAWEINALYIFQGGRLDIFHHGYGGLDNNGAGLMIAMGLPFAYAAATCGPKRWKPQFLIVGLILGACMIHAVMMSYSRGAMLSGCVGLAWLLWHHRPRGQAMAMAVVLIIGVSVLAGPEIRDRFMSTKNFSTDYSAQSRLDSWSAGWQIAWDQPLLGHGIRNSNHFSRNYGADFHGRTIHNQYLQIAADSGIPAVLVYIGMVILAIVTAGRCRRRCLDYLSKRESLGSDDTHVDHVAQGEKICLALQASLIIFAVDSMFLSLEMFELPWILLVMAGVLPRVLDGALADSPENAADPKATVEQRQPIGPRNIVRSCP